MKKLARSRQIILKIDKLLEFLWFIDNQVLSKNVLYLILTFITAVNMEIL